jgi:deoxycytidylate deaminase
MVSIDKKDVRMHILSAAHEARKSPMAFKHGAIIVKNGKQISSGYNRRVSRPFYCKGGDYSIHAEIDVINKISDFALLKNADLYVVRVLLNDDNDIVKISSSYPCHACRTKLMKVVKKYGLKRVIYMSEMCKIIVPISS